MVIMASSTYIAECWCDVFWWIVRKDTYGVYAEPVDPEEVCGLFFLWILIMLLEGNLSWKLKLCFNAASWLSWCDWASNGLCHSEEEVGKWILSYLGTIWGV